MDALGLLDPQLLPPAVARVGDLHRLPHRDLPGALRMIRFLDGPARGSTMGLHRVPIFLRVVIDRRSGKVDALDQLDDVPMPGEAIHVYQGVPGTLSALRADWIVCVRGSDGLQRAATGSGDYRHRPDVEGETVRETEAWRAWCRSQPEAVEVPA